MRRKPIAIKKTALAPAIGAMKEKGAKLTQMARAGHSKVTEAVVKEMGGPPPNFKASKPVANKRKKSK